MIYTLLIILVLKWLWHLIGIHRYLLIIIVILTVQQRMLRFNNDELFVWMNAEFFRVSLTTYYPSLTPVSMESHIDEHLKRSRYPADGNLSISVQPSPLSIDIKRVQIFKSIDLFQYSFTFNRIGTAIIPTTNWSRNTNIRWS